VSVMGCKPFHHTHETRRLLSRQCRKHWTKEKREAASVAAKERAAARQAEQTVGDLIEEMALDQPGYVLKFMKTSAFGHEDVVLGDVFVGSILSVLPQSEGPVSFTLKLPGLIRRARHARSRGEARLKVRALVSLWLEKTGSELEGVLNPAATG